MVRCPACKSQSYARRSRTAWMHVVPALLLFQCDDCGTEYCALLRMFNFRRPTVLTLLLAPLIVLLAILVWQLWGTFFINGDVD